MPMKTSALAIGAAVLLWVTAATAGSDFMPAPPPKADKVLVYFYRMPSENMGFRGAEIFVDGKKLFGLAVQEYSYAYLSPGTHTVRAEVGGLLWDKGGQGPEMTITANAGETHYERVSVGMTLSEYNPQSGFVLNEVKPLLGERQLAIMHLDPDTQAKLPSEFQQ